jgi:hypothetical protein
MIMNFLTAIQAYPNHAFPLLEITNEHSLTLSIGEDCLEATNGNPLKAMEKFKEHAAEIILTHLQNLLSSQDDTNHEALREVVRLICANDQIY